MRLLISLSVMARRFFPVNGSSELAHWVEIQFLIDSRCPIGILLALRVNKMGTFLSPSSEVGLCSRRRWTRPPTFTHLPVSGFKIFPSGHLSVFCVCLLVNAGN